MNWRLIKNTFGHLKTILVHKYWVFYYCCKFRIPWQGLVHDLSKFSPVEFWESVKYYQGGKKSPIPVIKKANGYSKAWQHHKGRNKHHYEYWTDNYDDGTTCIKIPYKYVLEMVADYLAAGKAYNGKSFTYAQEYDWWLKNRSVKKMHGDTKAMITVILNLLANHKNKETFKRISKFTY